MKTTKLCNTCKVSYQLRSDRIGRSKYCSKPCFNASKRYKRRGRVDGDQFVLPLSGGQEAILDTADRDLEVFAWHTRSGYARACINGRLEGLQRVILSRKLGRPLRQDEITDHVNRNRLDNRRANLRVATLADNARNSLQVMRDGLSSQYSGVCFIGREKRWGASITVNRQRLSLGSYRSELEAAYVRDQFAIVLHGEFAYLNVLDPVYAQEHGPD